MRPYASLAAVGVLAACVGGGSAPGRPAVSLADEVGAIDRDLVVGTWQCRELNPYPERPLQAITTTYEADGRFTGQGRSAEGGPVGGMIVDVWGSWAVEGDQLVASDVRTEARAADDNPAINMLAGLGAAIANTMMATQREGASDVLRLTPNDLVMRPIGVQDAPVIACTR